jgi:hypothetical protein
MSSFVYNFQCLSFDVALYLQTSQSMIEHDLIPLALLTFVICVPLLQCGKN